MLMKSPILATLVIGIAGLAAEAGAFSQTSQNSSQDPRILKEVRQILTSEHAFDGMSISPSVRKGVVTLKGTVAGGAPKPAARLIPGCTE
jgi:osmotically-inducible protein OsmY